MVAEFYGNGKNDGFDLNMYTNKQYSSLCSGQTSNLWFINSKQHFPVSDWIQAIDIHHRIEWLSIIRPWISFVNSQCLGVNIEKHFNIYINNDEKEIRVKTTLTNQCMGLRNHKFTFLMKE